MTLDQLFQQGRWDDAKVVLTAHLGANPNDFDTCMLLGQVCLRAGDANGADQAFRTAGTMRPNDAMPAFAQAVAALERGDQDAAAERCRAALGIDPGHVGALYNLAWVLRRQGQDSEPLALLRRVVTLDPSHHQAWFNLGNLLMEQGEAQAAIDALTRACTLRPDWMDASVGLAETLRKSRRFDEAEAVLAQAGARGMSAPLAVAMGNLALDRGLVDEAEQLYRQGLNLEPSHVDSLINLGRVLHDAHRLEDIAPILLDSTQRHPGDARLANLAGLLYLRRNDLDKAESCFRRAIASAPANVEAACNLGTLHSQQGDARGAAAQFRRALALDPVNPAIHSNLLMALVHCEGISADEVFNEHLEYGRRQEGLVTPFVHSRPNASEADRTLRLGFVSPDLREHAVAYFFEPVLAGLKRLGVECRLYMTRPLMDSTSQRLRSMADGWRDLSACNPDHAAEIIRQDNIDILVDLAGHTAFSGLPIFVRKPAPIQMSWLGYPATTGLTRMDYRIIGYPATAVDIAHSTEKLETVIPAFQPPHICPAVSPPPSLSGRPVVFGSLNKSSKLGQKVFDTWARLLHAVPESCLLLVTPGADSPAVQTEWRQRVESWGINPARLDLRPTCSLERFLQLYAEIDIALDPFPYGGGTTSLLTVWMGVPMIALRGTGEQGQTGGMLLDGLGAGDLIAADEEDYIRRAAALAADPEKLVAWRTRLRPMISTSLLMRRDRTATELDALCRNVWKKYVETANNRS